MKATSRWNLPYPELTDPADVPAAMKALAEPLDQVAMDDQGTLASRPVSTAVNPGKKGRYYYATDTGVIYRDTATEWVAVNRPTDIGEVNKEAGVTINEAGIELVPVNVTVAAPTKALVWGVIRRLNGAVANAQACNLWICADEVQRYSGAIAKGAAEPTNQSATGIAVFTLTPGSHKLSLLASTNSGTVNVASRLVYQLTPA